MSLAQFAKRHFFRKQFFSSIGDLFPSIGTQFFPNAFQILHDCFFSFFIALQQASKRASAFAIIRL